MVRCVERVQGNGPSSRDCISQLIWIVAAMITAAGSGCSNGIIGSPDGRPIVPANVACNGDLGVTETPLRRLTHTEYNRTVADLLGDHTNPANAFPSETSGTGFNNNAASLGVGTTLAELYMNAAEDIAARAVTNMQSLLPCDPTDDQDACASSFIRTFVGHAFRRPLSAEETQRFEALYASARDAFGFDKSIEMLVQAALQSPSFLYRVEFEPAGNGGAVANLAPHEMASRLSYFLWGSMPDDALFAAAEANELRSADQIEAQATRMLADPRAREVVATFHEQWLSLTDLDVLNKDLSTFPAFDDSLKASLKEESLRFLDHVVFDAEGDLDTMLSADYTFVDPVAAAHYGLSTAGPGFEKVPVDTSRRAGILTHAGVLALNAKPNQTSPTSRGKYVRERFFCHSLPEPPAGVDTSPPEVDPTLTTRERFQQHMTDPTCASCHRLTDNIGYGFEHFDAIGAWRDDENGRPIDDSGVVVDTETGDIPFLGAAELAQTLANTEQVRSCFVEKWFTFAQGRGVENIDACTLNKLTTEFTASGRNVQELLVAIARTEAFRVRLVSEEVK